MRFLRDVAGVMMTRYGTHLLSSAVDAGFIGV